MIDTPAETMTAFSRLVQPIDPHVFLSEYYERRPLFVPRGDDRYFAGVLTAEDLDEALENRAIARSLVRMAKDGAEWPAERLAERHEGSLTDRLGNARMFDQFVAGQTLILNAADRLFPRLSAFCEAIEREVGFRANPNVYVTPFSAQGFATHYDDHDVFVMQVMGVKRWRLFNSPVPLPGSRHAFSKMRETFTIGEPEQEITLRPGDTLYIPRGFLHDAVTDGTTSAHITLGFYPPRRVNLLEELALVAEDLPEFRRSLPPGRLDDADALTDVRRLLTDLVASVDLPNLVARRRQSFLEDGRPDLQHRFRDLASLNQLNLATVVRRRTRVLFSVDRSPTAPAITVRFQEQVIPVQPFLENALDLILGERAFAVSEIDGLVTDSGRLEIVKTFLRTGLLEVVAWNVADADGR